MPIGTGLAMVSFLASTVGRPILANVLERFSHVARSGWRRVGTRTRRALRWILLGALVSVLSLNLGVRCAGGDPFLLSVRFLPQKATALTLLLGHGLFHWEDEPEPAAAVRAAARRHRVPECFALSVARVESGLRPHVISSAGAMGLMQLMPATARGLDVDDPFSVRDNADGGVRYLRKLWRRYRGDRRRVLAAYNAGPGAVPRKGPIPRATRGYVKRVLKQRCLK